MSIDVGAFISMTMPDGTNIFTLLRALLNGGWKFLDHGNLCYLPLGDKDYEWTTKNLEEENMVLQEIRRKVEIGETIGVVLTWEGVGGEFMMQLPGEIIFTPSISRKQLSDGSSDVSWYLDRLLPPLKAIPGAAVLTWSWKESP